MTDQIDKLWEAFQKKQIKSETPVEDVAILYRTFVNGAFEMFKLITLDHRLFFEDLNNEFQELAGQMKEKK